MKNILVEIRGKRYTLAPLYEADISFTEAPIPRRTKKAYKLFATKKNRPGELFPLFIGANIPTPMGVWIAAEYRPTPGFAHRPGWHVGALPVANHLKRKDGTFDPTRIWAEVEIPADIDWQAEADKSPTRDIKDEVPVGGFYRFKRPAHQGGEWWIAGAIKVNKILSWDEVEAILKQNNIFERTLREGKIICPKCGASGKRIHIDAPGTCTCKQCGEVFPVNGSEED